MKKPLILKPRIQQHPRVETPQCSATVPPPTHSEQWRLGRYKELRPHYDPTKCQRESTLSIDKKPYCRIHAGQIALEKWMKGEIS